MKKLPRWATWAIVVVVAGAALVVGDAINSRLQGADNASRVNAPSNGVGR